MVVNVCTPGSLDNADSYAIICIELVRYLDAMGIHCNVSALGDINHPNCPPDVNRIAHQRYKPADGSIYLGYPSNIYKHQSIPQHGPRILITMFESSKIPCTWIEPLNQMDAVIVPSTFCADVFKSCGVTVPIHTIPLGIGSIYQPFRRPQRDKLTFLTFLDRGARKGGLAAQHAFMLAFGDSLDYHLILKMRKPRIIVNLTNANMTMIQQDYTEQQMYELYCSADVMIDCNKGEGFGLLPRQASICGCVTLSTDWGGTHDQLDQWGWGLPYKLTKADWAGHAKFEGKDLGEWAEPKIEEISQILLDVSQRRDWYQEEALKKSEKTRSMYSWRAFAEDVLDVWKGC